MRNTKVGFVGLGSMGFAMARNVLKAGLPVCGYDLADGARAALVQSGGSAAASPAEAAAEVDVLVVMVVDAAQAEQALFGENGAAAAARKDTVVMVCSTIAPKSARTIAARVAAAGLLPLDAPVSGGKAGAVAGTLTVMAAGSEAAFDKARPVLEAVSGRVFDLGREPGMGSTYKVVHQLAAGTNLAVAAEVMALGASAGCDTRKLFEIISISAGCSWMFTDRVPHMLDDDYAPRSMVDIFVKDLGLVVETGEETGTPLPLATAAVRQFVEASKMGHGKIDDSAVVKVYEAATGKPVKAT